MSFGRTNDFSNVNSLYIEQEVKQKLDMIVLTFHIYPLASERGSGCLVCGAGLRVKDLWYSMSQAFYTKT